MSWVFLGGASAKNLPANLGAIRNPGSIPGSWRSPGGGKSTPLQYFCLENSMDKRSLAGYSPLGRRELDTAERQSSHVINVFQLLSGLRFSGQIFPDVRRGHGASSQPHYGCTLARWSRRGEVKRGRTGENWLLLKPLRPLSLSKQPRQSRREAWILVVELAALLSSYLGSVSRSGFSLQTWFPMFFVFWRDTPSPTNWSMTMIIILAWRIPWTEESGRLESMGSQELDMT